MPKIKTKSAAKKRFSITGSGKVKYFSACLRHNTGKRPQQMKRQNRGSQLLSKSDAKIVIKNYLRNS